MKNTIDVINKSVDTCLKKEIKPIANLNLIEDFSINLNQEIKPFFELLINTTSKDEDKTIIMNFFNNLLKEKIDAPNIFLTLIKDKRLTLDCRHEIGYRFSDLEKDDKLIDMLIEFINDKSIDGMIRYSVITSLITLDDRDKVIDAIMPFAKRSLGIGDLKILDLLFKDSPIAKHKNIFQKVNLEKYANFIIKEGFLESFFEAFDNKYIDIDMLIEKVLYDSSVPLYIKNNFLYTVVNGKEISTQREIDKSILDITIKEIMDKNASK